MLSRVFRNRVFRVNKMRKFCIPEKPKINYEKMNNINNAIKYGLGNFDKQYFNELDKELQRFFEYRKNVEDLLDPSDLPDLVELPDLSDLSD